jgi:precorrin-2/cobalt-factor-2 C20-methyltransferase
MSPSRRYNTPRQRITPLEGFAYGERPYFSTILCYRGSEAWG